VDLWEVEHLLADALGQAVRHSQILPDRVH
jgi:hypothetical protein